MRTSEILAAIPRLRALVVGDTAEASRETGMPRIGVVATEVTPGADGTVVALSTAQVAKLEGA